MNSCDRLPPIGPDFGAHRNRFQAHALERAQVSDEHLVVGMLRAGLVEVERVGVLHQKFAAAHQPEARSHLVAEFPLDVIEIERQILVRAHIGAEDLGDHLFIRGTKEHVALVAILDAQHLLAVGLVASALAPQVGRLDGRHQQLDGAGAVLLLAHDLRRFSARRGSRAAGRHRCRRPPAASCRRAASAGARRSRPLSAFRAGWGGRSGTGAWRVSRNWERAGPL